MANLPDALKIKQEFMAKGQIKQTIVLNQDNTNLKNYLIKLIKTKYICL